MEINNLIYKYVSNYKFESLYDYESLLADLTTITELFNQKRYLYFLILLDAFIEFSSQNF